MKFNVSGTITIEGTKRTFVKEIEAESENHAKNITFAEFGSNNGLKKSHVQIDQVKKI
ncbi:MAG: 50S ribosomal protein L18Ae [Candidatus Micrarchaeota archaeon]